MPKNIGVLTTGRIVPDDLAKVFGKLPISFLPYKGKRIIDWQTESLISKANLDKLYVLFPNKEWGKQYKFESRETDIEYIYVNPKHSLNQIISGEFDFFKLENYTNLILYHGDILIRPDDLANLVSTKGSVSVTASHVSDHSNDYPKTKYGYHLGLVKYNNPKDFISCMSRYKTFWDFMEKHFSDKEACYSVNNSYLSSINFSEFTDSRSKDFMSRSFNNVMKHENRIIKKSNRKEKIVSEYMWYQKTPDFLKNNTPKVYNLVTDENHASYEMDYINSVSLSDIFVFGNQNDEFIETCLKKIYFYIDTNINFINHDKNKFSNKNMIKDLFINKTIDRLDLYKEEDKDILKSFSIDTNSLKEKLKIIDKFFHKKENIDSMIYWHGDFCFSNILYEPFQDKIFFIDPRGHMETNTGLLFYDICKLGHSIIGGYDFIMALSNHDFNRLEDILGEDFNLDNFSNGLFKLQSQRSFIMYVKKLGYNIDEILLGIGLLFISMIPLHTGKNCKKYLIKRGYDFLKYGEILQNTSTGSRKIQ